MSYKNYVNREINYLLSHVSFLPSILSTFIWFYLTPSSQRNLIGFFRNTGHKLSVSLLRHIKTIKSRRNVRVRLDELPFRRKYLFNTSFANSIDSKWYTLFNFSLICTLCKKLNKVVVFIYKTSVLFLYRNIRSRWHTRRDNYVFVNYLIISSASSTADRVIE